MRYRWLCGAALVLAATGCGSDADERVPVRGTVYYHEQPLAGGTIVFTPDPERGGRGPLALGEVGKDGGYTLFTDGRPGAVVGCHRVTIAPAKTDPPPETPLPRRYSDPEHSGLSREVLPGKANTIDFHLD
jgi:hypothetical protein